MRLMLLCLAGAFLGAGCSVSATDRAERPNVLFVAVDDLNTWLGCLGDPQSRTPHIDRLAARGVLFERAYCTAPLCNPSRTSVLTGLRPSTSGVYDTQRLHQAPRLTGVVTLPEHFRANGYAALSCGKVFHKSAGEGDSDHRYWNEVLEPDPPRAPEHPPLSPASGLVLGDDWSFDPELAEQAGSLSEAELASARRRREMLREIFDWGPLDAPLEETRDFKTVERVIRELESEHEAPFFLACGILRPHLPWYVPRAFFDQYPPEGLLLPHAPAGDLDDAGVPTAASPDHLAIVAQDKWPSALQGYLAAVAYTDACVGRLLEALDRSAYSDNTIVVLWSDNGIHLGQKQRWRKRSLWEDAVRTPLIVVAPGVTHPGGRCRRAVSTLDLYPTLVELAELTGRAGLDGQSLVPLLRDPDAPWDVPAVSTDGFGQHAIRTERWSYIDYGGEGQELYDLDADPRELANLARNPDYAVIQAELAAHVPEHEEPPAPDGEFVIRPEGRSDESR